MSFKRVHLYLVGWFDPFRCIWLFGCSVDRPDPQWTYTESVINSFSKPQRSMRSERPPSHPPTQPAGKKMIRTSELSLSTLMCSGIFHYSICVTIHIYQRLKCLEVRVHNKATLLVLILLSWSIVMLRSWCGDGWASKIIINSFNPLYLSPNYMASVYFWPRWLKLFE